MEMFADLTQSVQAISSIAHNLRSLLDKAKHSGVSDEFTRELNEAIIAMQDTVIAAQRAALDAQSTQTRLISRIGQLEQEALRSRDWAREAARYELASTRAGSGWDTAYRLRDETAGEAPHWLCPNCFASSVKSFLQIVPGFGLQCLKCYPR